MNDILYIFNILNIQMDETFIFNNICECECNTQKFHNIIQNYIMIIII
jgi:hypothetical protein